MKIDKKIILTKHAKERMEEFGLHYKQTMWLILNSEKEKLDHNIKKHKKEKYGTDDVYHLRNGQYLFTVTDTLNKFTNEPCLLVITLVNQEVTIKKYEYV